MVLRLVRRALGGLYLCGLTLARPARAEPTALPPPHVERYQLPNGLDVVVEESHREPHVAVAVSYDIGSRDEPRGYEQLAHLVEHLTYGRSKHLEPSEGLDLLERAGAERMNGETQPDRTLYYEVVPSGALPLALWLESERMAFTLDSFTQGTFEHERDVIRNELRLRQGGNARFAAYLTAALFGENHPYSKSASPTLDLDDLVVSDAQWFFQHGYRPDNAHLVIVGDVAPEEARRLVTHYFGPVKNPASSAPARSAPAPALAAGHLHYFFFSYVEPFVAVYRAPPLDSPGRAAAEVFAAVAESFLRGSLVDEQRLATHVHASIEDSAAGSELWIQILPSKGTEAAALERALALALAQLWRSDLSVTLPEAEGELVEQEIRALEDPLMRVRQHVASLASKRNAPYDTAERIRSLRAVSSADLRVMGPFIAKPLLIGNMVRTRPGGITGPGGRVTTSP